MKKNKIYMLVIATFLLTFGFTLATHTTKVFAQDSGNCQQIENTYTVTITYDAQGYGGKKVTTETYTVTASSASDAEAKAKRMWEATKVNYFIFKSANAVKN